MNQSTSPDHMNVSLIKLMSTLSEQCLPDKINVYMIKSMFT